MVFSAKPVGLWEVDSGVGLQGLSESLLIRIWTSLDSLFSVLWFWCSLSEVDGSIALNTQWYCTKCHIKSVWTVIQWTRFWDSHAHRSSCVTQVMTTFMPPPPAATFLAFHPQDNNIIAIGMEDSTIQIYNVRVDEVNTVTFLLSSSWCKRFGYVNTQELLKASYHRRQIVVVCRCTLTNSSKCPAVFSISGGNLRRYLSH